MPKYEVHLEHPACDVDEGYAYNPDTGCCEIAEISCAPPAHTDPSLCGLAWDPDEERCEYHPCVGYPTLSADNNPHFFDLPAYPDAYRGAFCAYSNTVLAPRYDGLGNQVGELDQSIGGNLPYQWLPGAVLTTFNEDCGSTDAAYPDSGDPTLGLARYGWQNYQYLDENGAVIFDGSVNNPMTDSIAGSYWIRTYGWHLQYHVAVELIQPYYIVAPSHQVLESGGGHLKNEDGNDTLSFFHWRGCLTGLTEEATPGDDCRPPITSNPHSEGKALIREIASFDGLISGKAQITLAPYRDYGDCYEATRTACPEDYEGAPTGPCTPICYDPICEAPYVFNAETGQCEYDEEHYPRHGRVELRRGWMGRRFTAGSGYLEGSQGYVVTRRYTDALDEPEDVQNLLAQGYNDFAGFTERPSRQQDFFILRNDALGAVDRKVRLLTFWTKDEHRTFGPKDGSGNLTPAQIAEWSIGQFDLEVTGAYQKARVGYDPKANRWLAMLYKDEKWYSAVAREAADGTWTLTDPKEACDGEPDSATLMYTGEGIFEFTYLHVPTSHLHRIRCTALREDTADPDWTYENPDDLLDAVAEEYWVCSTARDHAWIVIAGWKVTGGSVTAPYGRWFVRVARRDDEENWTLGPEQDVNPDDPGNTFFSGYGPQASIIKRPDGKWELQAGYYRAVCDNLNASGGGTWRVF